VEDLADQAPVSAVRSIDYDDEEDLFLASDEAEQVGL
jgi:hypothetical protein